MPGERTQIAHHACELAQNAYKEILFVVQQQHQQHHQQQREGGPSGTDRLLQRAHTRQHSETSTWRKSRATHALACLQVMFAAASQRVLLYLMSQHCVGTPAGQPGRRRRRRRQPPSPYYTGKIVPVTTIFICASRVFYCNWCAVCALQGNGLHTHACDAGFYFVLLGLPGGSLVAPGCILP